jgi:putative salt-induced outer membrane protein YdiY
MKFKKYNKQLLDEMCLKNNIELVNNYEDNSLNSETEIEFLCSECKDYTLKNL